MDERLIYEIIFALLAVGLLIASLYFSGAQGSANLLKHIMQLVEVILQAVSAADIFYDMDNAQRYRYVAAQAELQGVTLPPQLIELIIEGAVTIIHRRKKEAEKSIQ